MIQSQLSIIVLNYHGYKDTVECLKSLQADTVVVVNVSDKGEKNEEGLRLKKMFPTIEVIESPNLGFSGGNNVGARYAIANYNPKYLLFLNNDTRVHKDAVSELIQASERNSDALALYSPKIYFESGYEYHHESYTDHERGKVIWYAGGLEDKKDVFGWHRGVDEVDFGQFDEEISTDFATGCCMLMTTESYKKVGPWNEKYFLYFEDLDYSRRLLKKKGKVIYVPTATVWHKNAGSTGGSGSTTHHYYQTRNRLYYGLQYGSLNTKIALVKHYIHESKTNTHFKKALWDALLGRMGKTAHV